YLLSRVPSAAARWPARRPLSEFLFARRLRRQPLTFIEPGLHTDLAVGRARLGEAVIDVRAQCLQRQLAVEIPFRARDFRAVQPPGHADLDAARAEPQRRLDRLTHRAAECHALFQLLRDRLGDEL